MTVNITTHPEFVWQMKRYAKKYRSLASDYADFLNNIRKDPFQGVDLGGGIRKVRMAVDGERLGRFYPLSSGKLIGIHIF